MLRWMFPLMQSPAAQTTTSSLICILPMVMIFSRYRDIISAQISELYVHHALLMSAP